MNAAFALNGLNHYRAHARIELGLKIGDVVEAHKLSARHQWLKRLAVLFGPRNGHGTKGAPVKGILQRQHPCLCVAARLLAGPDASQFQRSIHGLGAAVGEEDAIHA